MHNMPSTNELNFLSKKENYSNNALDFCFQESISSVIVNSLKCMLFSKITKKSSHLFLRGHDFISIWPQVEGLHEPIITGLIEHFAHNKYGDFLIDIGANIGLTSCQNGHAFKTVHMFEPNPLCCKILEVNTAIALDKEKFTIHPYALGKENKTSKLMVPKHNWGGAFIKDSNNTYNESTLAGKDGFSEISDKNYISVDIDVKNTSQSLIPLFENLRNTNLTSGVIKIDVEGYESLVLEEIARSLPSDMKCMIIFESWDVNFDIQKILNFFRGRAVPYKLLRQTPWKNPNSSRFHKLAAMLLKPKFTNQIFSNPDQDWQGDLILQVN